MTNRQYVHININDKEFVAEVVDGEVMGWQPIDLPTLNTDIDKCMAYLGNIKDAMHKTGGE